MLSDMISNKISKNCFAYLLFYFSVAMPPPKVKNRGNSRAYSPTKVANALQAIENGTSFRQAAISYEVLKSTLMDRLHTM